MIRITVSRDGAVVRKYSLRQDRIFIGRDPDCHVRIDNVAVSRQHASLTKTGDGWEVEDLQSGNGTYVDQVRVHKQALSSGQTLVIGKFSILFEIAEGESDKPSEAEARMSEGATFHMDRLDLQELVSKARQQAPEFRATLRPAEGQEPIVLNKLFHFAGSAPDCTIPAGGAFVAQRLAVILKDGAGHRLVRIGGRFGTLAVNGQRADSTVLQAGDKVDICGKVYEYAPG